MAARNSAHHLTVSFSLFPTSTSQSQTVNSPGWQTRFYFLYGQYLPGAQQRLVGTYQYHRRSNNRFNSSQTQGLFSCFPKKLTSFSLIIKLVETILSPCPQWKDNFKQKQNPHFLPVGDFSPLKPERKPQPVRLKTDAVNGSLGLCWTHLLGFDVDSGLRILHLIQISQSQLNSLKQLIFAETSWTWSMKIYPEKLQFSKGTQHSCTIKSNRKIPF